MKNGIVIFGCSRGIGKTLAISCKDIYSDIVLVDKDNLDDLKILFKNSSTKLHPIQGDILNFEFIKNKLYEISKKIKLNSGAYIIRGRSKNKDFLNTTSEDWDQDLNLALKGAFFSAQTLFPLLVGDNKAFLTISSISGQLVTHQSPGYHCAKAGIEQLTRYLAVNGQSFGVRTNCIRPGFIVQDEHLELYNSPQNISYREITTEAHPNKNIGKSKDLASLILYLISPEASFINGSTITIDGGLSNIEHLEIAFKFNK